MLARLAAPGQHASWWLNVRAKVKQERLARQEAQAIELVRLLHGHRVRLTRARIEIVMLEARMTLEDPVTSHISFKERERLESQVPGKPTAPAKKRGPSVTSDPGLQV